MWKEYYLALEAAQVAECIEAAQVAECKEILRIL
jgi:hypothetical protein